MNNVGNMQAGEQVDLLSFRPEDIVTFSGGLLGFEEFKRYVIVEDEVCAPFQWLLSVDEPQLGFPIVPVEEVCPGYDPGFVPGMRGSGVDGSGDTVYVIVTLQHPLERSTVNLKGPLVLDRDRRTGRQLVLTSREYPTDYPIIRESRTIVRR